MKFKVYGTSHDLIQFEGDIEQEHNQSIDINRTEFVVVGEDGDDHWVASIHVEYSPSAMGLWLISMTQADEGVKIPDTWVVSLKNEHSYSLALHVDTGEDVVTVERMR